MGNEHLGKCWLLRYHPNNGCPFPRAMIDSIMAVTDALHLPGKTSLAKEFVRSKNRDDASSPCSETTVSFTLHFLV